MRVFLSSVLVALLSIPVAHAAWLQVEVEGEFVVFTDVPDNAWFTEFVQTAIEQEVASGYKDASGKLTGRFGPADPVTVAQALKMSANIAGYDEEAYDKAVQPGCRGHWVCAYIAIAQKEELTLFADRTSYDRPATRAEVALLLYELFDVPQEFAATMSDFPFADVEESSPYYEAIGTLYGVGVVEGSHSSVDDVYYFRPDDAINRAELLKIAYYLSSDIGTPGDEKDPTSY